MDPMARSFAFSDAAPVMLLGAEDLARILTPELCFDALRQAYEDLAVDPESIPKSLGVQAEGGTYHVKAGLYPRARDVFAAKLNANFPRNPEQGLPTIQGLVLLSDATTGAPLAVMDSGELTARRTAAAAALAANFGARPNSRSMTILGCGRQAAHVLAAYARLFSLERVHALDVDPARARAFAESHRDAAHPPLDTPVDGRAATLESDIIVTCTTSTRPILEAGQVRAGTFIAAIGADNPQKQEIAPELFRGAAILVDDRVQCATSGDLHHAIEAGVVREADVRADLTELVSGSTRARMDEREIVLFDATGTGLQDVAIARAAYRLAPGSSAK